MVTLSPEVQRSGRAGRLGIVAGALAGAFLGVLLGPMIASAQAPTFLYACQKGAGNARIVDAATPCKKQEVRFQWPADYVPGPKGETGNKGDKGDKGDQGNQGIQGIQGIQGLQGDPGANVLGSAPSTPLFSSGVMFTGPMTVKLSRDEEDVTLDVPENGAMGNLYARVASAPGNVGSGKRFVVTVRQNGLDTALTCEIFETARTCNDTTHAVTFNEGDVVSLKIEAFNSPLQSLLRWSAVFEGAP